MDSVADQAASVPGVRRSFETARCVLLFGLLAVEMVTLHPPANVEWLVGAGSSWGAFWVGALHQIRRTLITGFVATLFLSWPAPKDEFLGYVNRTGPRDLRLPWIITHLLLAAALFALGSWLGADTANAPEKAGVWLLLWVAVSLLVFLTWILAAFPLRFWLVSLTCNRNAVLAGVTLGLIVDVLGLITRHLWQPLQRMTFAIVLILLRLIGKGVVTDPRQFVIGTPAFSVQITERCSGLEGIGLISAFVLGYVWYYRRELFFPSALLLLPIGAIAIWLTNSVRITALILIGGWKPGVATEGFHSVAGWFFFNLVACGVIWITWRSNLFAKPPVRETT